MPDSARTIITNAAVFDGRHGDLLAPSTVVVEGNRISSVTATDRLGGPPAWGENDLVINGTGRTLMPGLIDAHWHAAFATLPLQEAMTADVGYVHLKAGQAATATLLRGFTTVRDAGGPVFGLKRAIDAGILAGPRIFPSGAFITQSAGHGDFRLPYEVPRGSHSPLSHAENVGASIIADGADEVLRAAREQLMLGASQLKVMAGGGAASTYDPLDVTQYTERELRAAVEAAENWGTYVMVHAYTPRAVQQALRAGVKSIEHGHLLDDETVALIAEHDAWWCLQPFLDDEDAIPVTGASRAKQLSIVAGTDTAYGLAKKHGVNLAWGTDTLFDAHLATRQGAQLAKLTRWFTPAEILVMATSRNAALLALSGPRNPYPGPLGVIEPGALADLLLVDGNPLEDLDLLARPETSLVAILKDGRLVASPGRG